MWNLVYPGRWAGGSSGHEDIRGWGASKPIPSPAFHPPQDLLRGTPAAGGTVPCCGAPPGPLPGSERTVMIPLR